MSRIDYIREEEKKYHDYCYDNYKLFEKGSWLHKPVKTVMETLLLFDGMKNLNILDLGCGVGRNSIPLAEAVKEKDGNVVCVDLLDSALVKLNQYSEEYEVNDVIHTVKADIGNFDIESNEFNYIIAISSLEHVQSEQIFEKVLQQMAEGTKDNGVNCIIVNSEVEEIDYETSKVLEPLMEVNLPTEEMLNKLKKIYEGWETLKEIVKPLTFEIVRNERKVILKTNAITYVVSKNFK
ncbi:class I SAM-dependent methyltransferase [Bacillus solitudinis]|uniref:class I SAM-dependent methyltransferase n=1 Tax=Bacillus solitudinis TaxID=2014074 RepID=UPI000C232A44|nr:class I SAM-dependent methyltransferase [Bacillus solitudinis]